jgi:hypothetical protein
VNPALLRGKKLLLIGAPEHRWVVGRGADRWEDEEVRAIERFVARGNALWVMGDGLCNAEALSEVTAPYGISFCAEPVGAVLVSGSDIYRHRLTRGVDEIHLGSVRGVGGNYLQVEEPAIALAEHGERPVMAYCEHKDGRVLVLSSLSAFSERYIVEQHNTVLLDNILRHLLHFLPPQTTQAPSEASDSEFDVPAKEQPGPYDGPAEDERPIHAPGPSATRDAHTHRRPERTAYGTTVAPSDGEQKDERGFDETGAEGGDERGSEADFDEADDSGDWDDAYL